MENQKQYKIVKFSEIFYLADKIINPSPNYNFFFFLAEFDF